MTVCSPLSASKKKLLETSSNDLNIRHPNWPDRAPGAPQCSMLYFLRPKVFTTQQRKAEDWVFSKSLSSTSQWLETPSSFIILRISITKFTYYCHERHEYNISESLKAATKLRTPA